MKYKVLSNLKSGDRTYTPGEEVDLNERDAEILLADRIVAVIEPELVEQTEPTESAEATEAKPKKTVRKKRKK